MTGQLFAQSGNLLGRDRAGIVSPLTAFVSQDVGNFLVCQCFVPWLHHGAAKLLAFDGHWALQTLQDNHGRAARPAGCKLRTRKRRILTGNAQTVGLVTGLTVRRENLFAAVARRKFCLLFATARTGGAFFCWRRAAEWIKTVTTEIS